MPVVVLHVITRLELGGAQRNTLYTVKHLDREQFSPALAWGPGDELDGEAEAIGELRREPIPTLVRPLSPASDGRALGRLVAVIRALKPDVVHTHSSKAGVLGRTAARIGRVPVVVHSIHGFGFTPLQRPAMRALFITVERVMSRLTTHFIAVSEANLREGATLGLFTEDRVTVIRSGIALDRYRQASGGDRVRRRLGLSEGGPLVVQIGNFKPQKAPLDFVRMASEVARTVDDVRFVMVGDGVLRPAAERLAAELGVADRILFPGWWDDVPGLLDAACVSVLGSRHEGLPRAAVESLAAGVPVVATAVDGTPEVVQDGVNGFLVGAGDVQQMAERVSSLLRDGELWRRLSRGAPHVLAEFDIDRMVRRQEELYRWLLGRNPS
jgi:glycosyltransferase involved in cell wall biosynthesis